MVNETLKSRIQTFVCEYKGSNGYAPSYREIQRAVGVKSTSTVYEYIRRLEAEGCLNMHANRSQTATSNSGIHLGVNTVQRIRVDVADGGVLFLDCSLENEGMGQMRIAFSGIVDASRMRGPVGSVVGCAYENE